MRVTFLDISKSLDDVWYEGLIFKLKTYDVESNLLKLLENLSNRLSATDCSKWSNVFMGKY